MAQPPNGRASWWGGGEAVGESKPLAKDLDGRTSHPSFSIDEKMTHYKTLSNAQAQSKLKKKSRLTRLSPFLHNKGYSATASPAAQPPHHYLTVRRLS